MLRILLLSALFICANAHAGTTAKLLKYSCMSKVILFIYTLKVVYKIRQIVMGRMVII